MSEKIFRLLLRLYPSRFRQDYGEEALQLFRDRTRDETGWWPSARLWLDLFSDLVVSLPREYADVRLEMPGASANACSDGMPIFFVFETVPLGWRPLVLGGLLSLITVVSFPRWMNQVTHLRSPAASSFASPSVDGKKDIEPQQQVESGEGVAQSSAAANSTLDAATRHRIIASAIASIKQHHIDPVDAQKASNALLAHERAGDDSSANSVTAFAQLVTKQMREATGDNELELLYSPNAIPERVPGPPAPLPTAYRDEMQRVNCTFEKVEMLQNKIGYFKLNGFPDTSACKAGATAAMAKLNGADALIFDLRDNRGGFPSMVSLIAAYLFDHPVYLYCPLENTNAESWTRSPVPGNKLADKPVYVLTSRQTISAAEQFTYNLKMLRRATLVGETTAGGAHAANLHSIGDNFYVATVEVRAINPYSKGDWNDTGVEPDYKVSASEALNTALGLVNKRLTEEKRDAQ
jgi:Peptidase family S41